MITHAVFPLTQLLTLLTRAVNCRGAGLFLPEPDGQVLTARLVRPRDKNEKFSRLVLKENSPIVEYLLRESRPLTREKLLALPEFSAIPDLEKKQFASSGIHLVMPLLNSQGLHGILALGKKKSGTYTAEDFGIVEDFASYIARSMQEQPRKALPDISSQESSVINRSLAIITSSLDIQRVFDSFIKGLKDIVDISWAAIALIEDLEFHFLALSSDASSPWQLGERLPIKDTALENMASNGSIIIEPDLSAESRFATGKLYIKQGLRSVACLPLVVGEEVIGSFIVASQHPHAYPRRQVDILEELSSRMAVAVENCRLYTRAQRMARIDELTGLLNRRSLDEIIDSEVNRHSRYGGVLSLIILDLDSMKTVNDKYGHLTGDKLLSRVGDILKKAIRKIDHGFRYGGDEFAILLPQTSADAAMNVAERIRSQIASGTRDIIPTTASLGLASWPADGLSPGEVIAAADAALYQVKRHGGNRCQRYQARSLISKYETVATQRDDDDEALSTIYFMAAAVDARDRYTGDHSRKVNTYAVALAKALNLGPQEISRISACALLHDIGKVGISDKILNKPDTLTKEEWRLIKSHPHLGATIASHVQKLSPFIPGILYHHERYDGTGYPEGLAGDAIPLEARILAIADAFAAMTSTRHYSNALPFDEAVEEIKRGTGTQFDPNLVEVFLSIAKEVSSKYELVNGVAISRPNAAPVASGGLK